MTEQPDFAGSVEHDPVVGSDAMRWRPEPAPAIPCLPMVVKKGFHPCAPRPAPTPEEAERAAAEANALWVAIGDAYRGLNED